MSTAPAIQVENLTVSYGPVPALLDVTLDIPSGQLVGVIGPNGSGKSTLLKAILGFVTPDFGDVKIFGEPAENAKGRVAYVPQRGAVDWDFPITVREVALMGRYGRVPWWRDLSDEDYQVADEALAMVRMEDFRDRQIGQLSGGESTAFRIHPQQAGGIDGHLGEDIDQGKTMLFNQGGIAGREKRLQSHHSKRRVHELHRLLLC